MLDSAPVRADCKLMLGDCLERMAEIPDGSVDCIIADLPYGTTACKWDSVIPFEPLWAHYRRVTKKNAAIVLTASQPFTSALVMSNPKHFKYSWVWEKSKATGHGNVKRQPMRAHEDIVVFYYEQCFYNPQMTEGKPYNGRKKFKENRDKGHGWFGDKRNDNIGTRYPRTVQRVPSEYPQSITHPTQKPVALMEYLIRTYTHEGETVLDNVMGSGTTGVAAANAGRAFIGIERDPAYFEIARQRIAAAAP